MTCKLTETETGQALSALDERRDVYTALISCARAVEQRDALMKRAAELGIPKAEIARIMGMSRQRVTDITNDRPRRG